MSGIKIEITEEQFNKVAEVASESRCLRQRPGEHGTDWGIILNGHLMMTSTVDEHGERQYWQHF